MKIRSVVLFAALLSSAAFSQTMTAPKDTFEPGKPIPMIVKFDSAVEPGSTVAVNYQLRGSTQPDQKTFSGGLRFRGPVSTDNKTFILQAVVDDNAASGEYVFGSLGIDKNGFRPGENDTAPKDAPVINIKNSRKDEKQLTVPPFSIQVK